MSDYINGPEDSDDAIDNWIPDEALKGLVTEREVHPEESEEMLTRRLFRENSANAALGIIHIAVHGTNERTRLDASKYVVERVLGKVGDDAFDAAKSPLESLMEGVLMQAEAYTTAAALNPPSHPTQDDE